MREHDHKYRSHEDRRYANALMGKHAMSADEAQAFDTAVEIIQRLPAFVCERRLALEAMEVLAAAKYRAERRRHSDKQTDRARRKLIGARLPMEQAKRVERCAKLAGVSVYRFVIEALQMACEMVERKCDVPTECTLS